MPGGDFTYDAAVRVFLWNKAGKEIPGLTKRDNKKLNDAVANDPELSSFADALLLVSKKDTWPDPSEYWESKTTLSDLNDITEIDLNMSKKPIGVFGMVVYEFGITRLRPSISIRLNSPAGIRYVSNVTKTIIRNTITTA